MLLLRLLFWVSLAALAWTHVLYPAVVWAVAKVGHRRLRKGDVEPTVTVVVAAYNEEAVIARRIENLLELDYPQFEVIVVCDDATPGGLAAFQEAFQLQPFPEALWRRIPSGEVRTVYQSLPHDALRVLDKHGAGRADALNAAINASRFPLVCAIDPGLAVAGEPRV